MKRKQWMGIILAAGMLLAAGCGQKTENTEPEQAQQEVPKTDGSLEEEKEDVQEGNEADDFGQLGDENMFASGTTYSWEEITVSIPDRWEGKYRIEQGEEGFSLIQTASEEKMEGMGFLCGFYRTDRMVLDEAGVTTLAYTDTQVYYMQQPTDVSFYYEDEGIAGEYHEMSELIGAMVETMEIDKEGVKYNPDEFILPLSSTVLLKEDDYLINYSDNELTIARNEIYARHGRQFDSRYLQNYFETCSWYEGTVAPKEFDEAVLSQIEKDNLEMIKKAEEAYKAEHPYPKEYSIGSKVKEDLDGDGSAEQIQYQLKKADSNGEYSGVLILDGQEYELKNSNIYLEDPVEDVFYVTDLDSFSEGLEIAVLDHGPSNDPITYFFTYKEKELDYIGSVSGFPFKQLSGYNGFASIGNVTGEERLDFPYTCSGYGDWWYDGEKLQHEEMSYHRIVPEGAHQLYEDITVYLDMDESGFKTIIPAQEKVFFTEVFQENQEGGWAFVKGKDGSKGYIHLVNGKIAGLDKELGEVFSNVNFSD